MTIMAVITTFNEEETIGLLVRKLIARDIPVIVVDDWSKDNTIMAAESAGAKVLIPKDSIWSRHVGIGPALIDGWEFILENYPDVTHVVQIDAGGSHDPSPIAMMQKFNADIVIGTRFGRYSYFDGSPIRKFRSRLASWVCNLSTGQDISDWTSGYRMFSRYAIEVLIGYHYEAKMHGFQIESLWHAILYGFVIRECPIAYTAGRSSFNLAVAWEAFKVWLKILEEVSR